MIEGNDMNDGELFTKYRLCAICWGPIVERCVDGQLRIECSRSGPRHEGSVSKRWVERRLAESRIERMEVHAAYGEILGTATPRETLESRCGSLYGDGGGL
jgi:hypothetical protein